MIVGFTITDFMGHEEDAVTYINKVCILESPDIARNIVEAGPGVNVFSNSVLLEELTAQPFRATPIEIQDGKYLLVSKVNFNLELVYNGDILRLVPTEYIYIEPKEIPQFKEYIAQNLVKLIPEVKVEGKPWILDDGEWNDTGVWVDSNFWRDSNEQ